jgi:hypothetical protein
MAFRLVVKRVGLKYLLLKIRSSFPSPLGGIKAGIEGVILRSLPPLKRLFNWPLVFSNNKGNRIGLIYNYNNA